MYGKELGITRKYFKCLVKEYYKQFNINWTVDDGISPRCVYSICKNMIFLIMYLISVKNVSLKTFQK
jgi:hypothetical protein